MQCGQHRALAIVGARICREILTRSALLSSRLWGFLPSCAVVRLISIYYGVPWSGLAEGEDSCSLIRRLLLEHLADPCAGGDAALAATAREFMLCQVDPFRHPPSCMHMLHCPCFSQVPACWAPGAGGGGWQAGGGRWRRRA